MDSLLNRYRNITVLLLVVVGQLILLAVQVKNDRDIRFIRVWTITAITPFARLVEGVRGGSAGFFRNYIRLRDADAENRQLRDQLGKLKMDNIFLRNELNQADRVRALQMFQAQTQSKTIAATVFGVGAAASAKMVYVDRGSVNGVQRGMAVVTPDGIVGKVTAAYPMESLVLLVTDPDFAAGVISQKNQVRGDLKGTGKDYCMVDYVPLADKVEVGDWFYTSGDDRIFPRGFPVGVVKEVHEAQPFKEILVEPSGPRRGLEEVLIILSGVHQEIPNTPPTNQPVYIAPPPPGPTGPDAGASGATGVTSATGTAADRLRARYKQIGDAQKHIFGEGLPGSKPPNFNMVMPSTGAGAPAGGKSLSALPGAGAKNPAAPVSNEGGVKNLSAPESGVRKTSAPAPDGSAPPRTGAMPSTGATARSGATAPAGATTPTGIPARTRAPAATGATSPTGAPARTGALAATGATSPTGAPPRTRAPAATRATNPTGAPARTGAPAPNVIPPPVGATPPTGAAASTGGAGH